MAKIRVGALAPLPIFIGIQNSVAPVGGSLSALARFSKGRLYSRPANGDAALIVYPAVEALGLHPSVREIKVNRTKSPSAGRSQHLRLGANLGAVSFPERAAKGLRRRPAGGL